MAKGRLLLKTVNRALKEAGAREVLVQGDGYYYFMGGSASQWKESGVYGVFRLNDLTLEQWVEEWRLRKEQYERECA